MTRPLGVFPKVAKYREAAAPALPPILFASLTSATSTRLFVRHPGQYEGLLGGRRMLQSSLKLLFVTGRADVSVRGEWQRGMPSAGIALS